MSKKLNPIIPARVIWRDNALYSPDFDDVYFCAEDGAAESDYVYIQGNQLPERFARLNPHQTFIIAEIGFGTGLNFLMTWKYWEQYAPSTANLVYYTTELYPLTREDIAACHHLWPDLAVYHLALQEAYPILTPGFHTLILPNPRIQCTLMTGDARASFDQLLESADYRYEHAIRGWAVDAWFLDGFTPEKNPALWDEKLFFVMQMLSDKQTTFSSFTASGSVIRHLAGAGFMAQKYPGFGKKRHMIRGMLVQGASKNYQKPSTPWHLGKSVSRSEKRAVIIGAGLAGCFTAYALSKRGFSVTLIEAGSDIAAGGSANQYAVLYPKLSAFSAPFTQFMCDAFLYAQSVYPRWLEASVAGACDGLLQFLVHPRDQKSRFVLGAMLAHYPDIARFVSAEEASCLAGVSITQEALYILKAGWMHMPQLCAALIADTRIEVVCNTPVEEIVYHSGSWHVGDYHTPVLVLANAAGLTQYTYTAHLPLKQIAGGISLIHNTALFADLKIPLCGDGHVLPQSDGIQAVGATFHLGKTEACDLAVEHARNMQKINQLPLAKKVVSGIPVGYWGGIRTAAPDYLPLAGPVVSPACFEETFYLLKKNTKHYVPTLPETHPGLYVCSGFGSRGLCTIPLTAEYIAGMIAGAPPILPRHLRQALSPQRFLLRNIGRMSGHQGFTE